MHDGKLTTSNRPVAASGGGQAMKGNPALEAWCEDVRGRVLERLQIVLRRHRRRELDRDGGLGKEDLGPLDGRRAPPRRLADDDRSEGD